MADCDIAKKALKVVIGQICQNIGWHAVQSTPMDILVDVLQRYIIEISKSVHQYSTQYNRTEPNLDDLGLTFKDFGIVLQEIEEYISNVESVPPVYKVAAFPVKHPSNLQHPKPDSRELLVRPEHIPSYLPLMHPDEEDLLFSQQSAFDGLKKNSLEAGASGDSPSPLSSPKHGLKRHDWPSETSKSKLRYYTEEEGRPMREVTSVFMTPAGFVSPINEGKTPDASLPSLVDSPPPTPEPASHPASSKKDGKFKDLKKEKSSKSKKDKKAGEKDVKKLKSSKKEKENKENATVKHDKSLTSSSSSKKDHGSHKSAKSEKGMKSDDSVRQKSKSDKMKLKAHKEDMRRMKDTFKLSSKLKAKFKHSGGSGSSSHIKSSKYSSKKFKTAKSPKIKHHLKLDKAKVVELPPLPPSPVPPKEISFEHKVPVTEAKDVSMELEEDEFLDEEEDELDFRGDTPERLVIDDSLETQARQERESRLEVIDECIDAVIRRGEEQSAVENRAMDDTINSVVRGPPILMKKLEAKDIYAFTDASDGSSLSSCEDTPPHSPAPKKEKKTKSSDSPKRSKKDKHKKKKDSRSRSPNPYTSPKSQKSSFVLKVEERTPSPILKDDLLSSDGSTPSSSPRSSTFFDHSPQVPSHVPPAPLLSHVPPLPLPFVPGSSFASSPFVPMRNLPCHTTPHFPTPPLFVTNSKSESGSTFQNIQPLNLAKSGPSSLKSSPEKLEASATVKVENSDLIKKAANIIDKSKAKVSKKEKLKKKGKKEPEKVKEKKDEIKEKEKLKPKEKPKLKPEKNVKVDKRKSKPEKKKIKDEKAKEDSTVPKMTLKLSSGPGSTKIFVKPNTKTSTSLSSSSSPEHTAEDEPVRSPTPPLREPTPSPPRVPTPPPPRIPTPPPPRSPTPPPVVKAEVKEELPPPVVAPPPISNKATPPRGRGRGKKAATVQPVVPPARTVITQTLGTIVDDSGNKIWICPACSRADDGSPMIGCDECDDWYHWVCVGIVVPPKEEENWFCVRCIAKRQTPKDKRKRKKHKKEK